jgi:hypothetical protein
MSSVSTVSRAPFAWGQAAFITAVAVLVFVAFRQIPTGTDLNHMDFRVENRGAGAIEFCDPLNPQFIPVVAMRSPVAMSVRTEAPPAAGREVRAVVSLRTANGKVIAPPDLLVTHTRRLHLLVVDPALGDYQHLHPEPGAVPGEWAFRFTPRGGGTYRVFADFTPAATARGLYASDDLVVSGPPVEAPRASPSVEQHGHHFTLAVSPRPARAGQPLDLEFTVVRDGGGPVALEKVMDAYAHLVAFDAARSGFAHLHPVEAPQGAIADPARINLRFKLTVPRAGIFTVWAQLNVAGREEFVPFRLEVAE